MTEIPENADILPPSDDRIFKVLLTHKNAEPVLRSVVSTVIERPVVNVQILNTELPVSDVEEKAQRLDINCTVDGGDQINVEMQSSRTEEPGGEGQNHKGFINKFIYYMTDLHSSQKSKGIDFYNLARTFQITFCGYNIIPKHPDFVHRFSMRRDTGEQISDQINMIIVEMDKLKNRADSPANSMTLLESWSIFFKFANDPAFRGLINDIIKEREEIAMATELLMEISQDPNERALFRSRKKAEMERVSNLLTVEKRGMMRVFELLENGVSLEDAKRMLGIKAGQN